MITPNAPTPSPLSRVVVEPPLDFASNQPMPMGAFGASPAITRPAPPPSRIKIESPLDFARNQPLPGQTFTPVAQPNSAPAPRQGYDNEHLRSMLKSIQQTNVRTTTPQQEANGSVVIGVIVSLVFGMILVLGIYQRKKALRPPPQSQALPPNVVPVHPLITPPESAYASTEGPFAPPTPLESTRSLLGPTPRTFDKPLAAYLAVTRPEWMGKDDLLFQAIAAQDRLQTRGQVVFAAIVQANSLLFEPGPFDHGVSLIWSPDAYYDSDPNALMQTALDLYHIKGTDQADPDVDTFARLLAGAATRAMNVKVPPRFTDGRAVYFSNALIHRKHLPDGYVRRNLLPVWTDPEPTGLLLPVPAAYWPASLVAWWKMIDPPEPAPTEKPESP